MAEMDSGGGVCRHGRVRQIVARGSGDRGPCEELSLTAAGNGCSGVIRVTASTDGRDKRLWEGAVRDMTTRRLGGTAATDSHGEWL
jgi:hypothetical protein